MKATRPLTTAPSHGADPCPPDACAHALRIRPFHRSNSTSPGFKNDNGWKVMLYNLTSDRAETRDLWRAQRPTAKAMLARFMAWQDSIRRSQGPAEIGCAAAVP